jgi:serine phosphatase RsbU (regulator of sigma subunit)
MVTDVPYLIAQFPGVPRTGQFLLFSQQYRSVAILIAVATLTLLLIKRVRATNRQRATLEGEMEAARRIQQMLAPAQVDRAPGCDVEVAFSPAREVGGDFYLCRVLPDGRQRLLLGDVSGKGAAAAMTAALLIGAAERRDADSPAKLLDHLNLVLCDCKLGGFATCLCADITSGGRLTAANAGHPPPYYNGKELPLEPSLPLGITLQTEYAETALQLEAGDRLTMLSDGVVEATNPTTNELFGFERTQQISGESAYRIASAAQQFGQEDDITVLTLKFAGSEVMLA